MEHSLFYIYHLKLLKIVFDLDYRLIFASILAFYVSQYLNLTIYYYLNGYRGFRFLISAVIAITVDALLFTLFANIGTATFTMIISKFANQFVMDILMVIIYSLCFAYIIDSVVKNNQKIEITKLDKTIPKKKINKNKKIKTETK